MLLHLDAESICFLVYVNDERWMLMFLNTLVWSCIGLYSHAVCAYDIGETQEVPRTCFLWHTAYMCKLSYKNNAFSMEHLRCTVHNAEKYWHCNLGVFTDDAPVCKVLTVDLYLILLFCLTCNHLTKLSENNSVIVSYCPWCTASVWPPNKTSSCFCPTF